MRRRHVQLGSRELSVQLVSGFLKSPRVAARKAPPSIPIVTSFTEVLTPFGGSLKLLAPDSRDDSTPLPRCGDLERFRDDREPTAPVLQLRPGSDTVDPSTREMRAATVSKESESVLRTELRVSGGKEDSSDVSARIAFGAHSSNKWMPALLMNGGRGIQMSGDKSTLTVQGTTYLPPIGRGDPLFAELMALAYAGALPRATGGGTLTITVPSPSPVQRGQDFSYTVTIAAAIAKRTFETIVSLEEPQTLSFRVIPNPDASPVSVKHARTSHRAGSALLRVIVLVEESQKNRVLIAEKSFSITG
jgi:hypothetical protein